MHDGQIFVLCIIALSIFGGTARSWFRAKAGLPQEDYAIRAAAAAGISAVTDLEAERKVLLLSTENEKLTGKIGAAGGAPRGPRTHRHRSRRAYRPRDRGAARPLNQRFFSEQTNMNPFEMVVAIIFLVTVGRVLQSYLRSRPERPVVTADDPDTIRMRDEMRSLKERIAVLERVITDNHGSLDLDRQIERLRDR